MAVERDRCERAAVDQLWARRDLVEALHGRPRQASALRIVEEGVAAAPSGERLDHREHVLALFGEERRVAHLVGAEVGRLTRLIHPLEQAVPHAGVAAEPAGHPSVSGAEQAVRRDRMRAAAAPNDLVGVDVGDRPGFEAGGDAFEGGDLDALTAARRRSRPQRQQGADRAVERREVPRLVGRCGLRGSVWPPDLGDHPAGRTDDQVRGVPTCSWTCRPERREEDVDQTIVDGTVRRQALAVGCRALQHDVGAVDQLGEPRLISAQVERQRSLAGVVVGERSTAGEPTSR